MVVEHAFITTLEAPDALRLASQFLSSRGFEATAQGAFAMGAEGWNVLEMTRGKKRAQRAKSVVEYPQQVRLEWDRGRVTVAASAFSPQEAQARTWNARPKGKPAQFQQQLLLGLCIHLQQLLESQLDLTQVAYAWTASEEQLQKQDRSRRRRNIWIAVTILVLFFAGIAGIIVATINGH
jgi:hypothetical protein